MGTFVRGVAALCLAMAGSVVGVAPGSAATPQRLDFEAVPGAPWEALGGVSASGGLLVLQGGILAIGHDETQRGQWWSEVDNVLGWTASARVRLDPAATDVCDDGDVEGDGRNALILADHTFQTQVQFGADGVCLRSGVMTPRLFPMDTQGAFHTYRVDVRGKRVSLAVDGRQVLAYDAEPTWPDESGELQLRNQTTSPVYYDWFSFDTVPAAPNCTIQGTPGDDTIVGTPGADVICAGDGNDVISGAGGSDVLIGGFGDDQLFGGTGNDILIGAAGFDFLRGDAGADTSYGGPGDDTFRATGGGAAGGPTDGADVLVGGIGLDTADYSGRAGSVRVVLDGFPGDGSAGEGDRAGVVPWQLGVTAPDVENSNGGSGDDLLRGSGVGNVIVGGSGADQVRGLGGADTIDVLDGAGVDTVSGGGGRDLCVADPGDALTSCEQ